MMEIDQSRRSFALGLAGVSLGRAMLPDETYGQAAVPRAYVLGPSEGEHLILRGGNIFIKAEPNRGSNTLAMGTQQILVGIGIPIHRHFEMDEAFYVIDGGWTFILNDVRYPIEKGGSIFIPKNAWHGFENPDRELHLLWIVAPPGLEAFFREAPPAMSTTQIPHGLFTSRVLT